MKIRRLCIALLLVVAAIVKQPLAAAAADNAIAVTAPKAVNIGSDGEWIPLFVQGVITANLAQYSGLTVIDRQNADMVRAEQKLGESTLYSDADALELGNLTHARYIVTGSITGKGASYALLFSITDAQTGETKASASVPNCLPSALENGEAANQISYDLMKGYGITLSAEAVSALTKGASVMTAQTSAQASVAKGIVAERSGSNIEALTYYIQAKKNDGKLKEATSRMSTMSTVVASGNFGANAKNLMKLRNDWDKLLREAAELIAANPPEFELRYFTDVEALELTEKNYENGTMSFVVGMPYLWQVDTGEENEKLAAELLEALGKIPESKNWGAKINDFPWSYGKEIAENGGGNWLYFAAEEKPGYFYFDVSLLDAQKKKIATESVALLVKFSKRFHTFPVTNDRKCIEEGYNHTTIYETKLTFSDVPVGNADTDTIYVDVEQKYRRSVSIVPSKCISEKEAIKAMSSGGSLRIGGFVRLVDLIAASEKAAPSQRCALDLCETHIFWDFTSLGGMKNGFFDSKYVSEVWLPEGIEEVEGLSYGYGSGTILFYRSSGKDMKIGLPASVKSIDYKAAWGDWKIVDHLYKWDAACLPTFYYAGTREQWNALNVHFYSNNTDIRPNVVCNYDRAKIAKAEEEAEAEAERRATITEVAVPDGQTEIAEYAFRNYSGLKTVTIPASVTKIGRNAFKDCYSLRTVRYTGSKEQWEKVKIEKKGNDPLKEARFWYKFAESDEAKAAQISEITELTVPDGQTEIEECAFAGYFSLMKVTIPESVTKIGKDAFVNCKYGIIVRYRGTKKQWKKIKIEDGNTVLKNALIFYEYKGD